jgi:hypothetical protein
MGPTCGKNRRGTPHARGDMLLPKSPMLTLCKYPPRARGHVVNTLHDSKDAKLTSLPHPHARAPVADAHTTRLDSAQVQRLSPAPYPGATPYQPSAFWGNFGYRLAEIHNPGTPELRFYPSLYISIDREKFVRALTKSLARPYIDINKSQ